MGAAGRLIGTAAAATALLGVLAAPALAAEDDTSFFRIKVSIDGGFTVDYGDPPGPNNADYSGKATTSYSTDLVSVARYRRGAGGIQGKITNTKGKVYRSESTSVVSHFPGSEPTEFKCDNDRGTMTTQTYDDAPAFGRDMAQTEISGGAGEQKELSFTVYGAGYNAANCFDAGHNEVGHYLHSPDTGSVMLGNQTLAPCCVIPRGAFNPNSDSSYGDSVSRNIHFDPGSNPHPESPQFPNHPGADPPHVFDGSSEVSFKIKEVKESKAERLRKGIHELPEGSDIAVETRCPPIC